MDLPNLNTKADKDANFDDSVGFIVTDVEQDNQRLDHVEEDRAHRQTLQRLAALPELNI